MSRAAAYARRFARIPQLLHLLLAHPQGRSIAALALELGAGEEQLREEVIALNSIDPAEFGFPDLAWPALDLLAADGEQVDSPEQAMVLKVRDHRAGAELGVELVSAHDVAQLYEAARSLLEVEPANALLREALRVLEQDFLGGMDVPGEVRASDGSDGLPARLRVAIRDRWRVRITYSRSWHPAVAQRTVEPYRLVSTRRGWELDAGPLDDQGRPRTYLLSNVRDAHVLDEHFQRPPHVQAAIDRNRAQESVELLVPAWSSWVVARFAESSVVLGEDDSGVHVRAGFLPPVSERVGLVLLIAGEGADVIARYDEYAGADVDLARQLLAHHGLLR